MNIKKQIFFSFIMGFFMSIFMSFLSILINFGWVENFFKIWFFSFLRMFPVGLIAVNIFAPVAKKITNYFFKD